MVKKYNEQLFKNSEIWENYDSDGELSKKAELLIQKIPPDVISILDVGCGNGVLTNKFLEKYEVVGVDNSSSALEHVKGETILASCDDIPVDASSFDMVFSSELLEHLPDETLHGTLQEMKRIARKYIFITVPFQEQLEKSAVLCPSCDQTFHIYGHIQSFVAADLIQKLPDFKLLWSSTLGNYVRDFNPALLRMRQKMFGQYFPANDHTICPYCANTHFTHPPKSIGTKLINGLNRLVSTKGKNYWLACLFERL